MCTELRGKTSWFLPFNQGWNDGAGNPPNPYGIQTDYFWKRIFTPRGLTDIMENYAQIVEEKKRSREEGGGAPQADFSSFSTSLRLCADC